MKPRPLVKTYATTRQPSNHLLSFSFQPANDPNKVRECTDALDAAGNTTAAIGKGFAIGSAALVSLALYGAFVVRLGIDSGVNILEPLTFSFLLLGAMLPYWFSALTMKSVGEAAGAMVEEVRQALERLEQREQNTICIHTAGATRCREKSRGKKKRFRGTFEKE